MKIQTTTKNTTKIKTDLIAVAVAGTSFIKGSSAASLDKKLGGAITNLFSKEKFKGKKGEMRVLNTCGRIPASNVFIYSIGKEDAVLDDVRKFAGQATQAANKIKAKTLALEVFTTKDSGPDRVQATVEGLVLANYEFTKYKSDKNGGLSLTSATFALTDGKLPAGVDSIIRAGQIVSQATNLARDLVNTPGSDLTPRKLGEIARQVARKRKIRSRIYNKREIERLKMNAFLQVAKGSDEPPVFIHLKYVPKRKNFKKIALVGKGVTFDSGGLSLKPSESMETMKADMGGAATVIAIIQAAAALKLPVGIDAYIAATENMPSGSAGKVGDIVKAMNGKTIEILNTDAEGRLTLADAYGFALRKKPDIMIELSTLTGACVVALGTLCSGIMGNDDKLIQQIISSAKKSGEKVWQLPLIEEYTEDLKSPIADLKNMGSRLGGTITAGLFLKEFIDGHKHWAHIDIAGPVHTAKNLDYCPKGGTGTLVRTLVRFLSALN